MLEAVFRGRVHHLWSLVRVVHLISPRRLNLAFFPSNWRVTDFIVSLVLNANDCSSAQVASAAASIFCREHRPLLSNNVIRRDEEARYLSIAKTHDDVYLSVSSSSSSFADTTPLLILATSTLLLTCLAHSPKMLLSFPQISLSPWHNALASIHTCPRHVVCVLFVVSALLSSSQWVVLPGSAISNGRSVISQPRFFHVDV
ncbi:unnamed protein product [Toxocara canis]|uniref:Secreted protein n=1 Tax=Toxocara canis TaxID=6265 RepID=A0A183UR85_TOXCA|nr:unnamed protein product [Toxocara canis]